MGGWCDQRKAIELSKLVLEQKPQKIADIGVFEGKSTLALAYACKLNGSGVVYAVDSWCKTDCVETESSANAEWWSALDLDGHYESFVRHMVRAEVTRQINVCRMTSRQASYVLPDLDMVHIDANHAEWPSTSDVVQWLPKVKTGGIIVLDDVNWESTQTAVKFAEKFCTKIARFDLSESCFAIYRKEK
jgi:predicted O-methyltransferase YrrM